MELVTKLSCKYVPYYYVDGGRGGEIGSPLVMVESAVIEAIERVMKSPRHERMIGCSRVPYRP